MALAWGASASSSAGSTAPAFAALGSSRQGAAFHGGCHQCSTCRQSSVCLTAVPARARLHLNRASQQRGETLGAAVLVGAALCLKERRRHRRWRHSDSSSTSTSTAAALAAAATITTIRTTTTSTTTRTTPTTTRTIITRAAALAAEGQAEDADVSPSSTPQKVVFACIFLHLLGFTMSGPLMPALRQHFSLAASSTGLITSAFPLGMFGAVFIFPILSDVIGRKPVLVISYLGVGVGFMLQALAVKLNLSFQTFLALRVLSGAFAGASTVVKAYIADASSPEMLPQWMGYRESAATVAFIIGPTIGGFVLAFSSLPFVIFFEGVTSVLAGLLVAFCLRAPERQTPAPPPVKKLPSLGAGDDLQGCPIIPGAPWVPIITIMMISCAYNFGQSFFDGFFPVLCYDRFGLQASAIGSVQTAMALVVFAVTTFIYGPTVRRLGLVNTAVVGLLLISCGLMPLGLPRALPAALLAVAVYAVGVPLFSPSVPVLLTRCAPTGRRGLVLGVDSAVNSVGRIVAPTLIGALYGASPARAFGLVGAVVAAGALVMFIEKTGLGLMSSRR